MTAEDWSTEEAEAVREEIAATAGLSIEEMAARRVLPLPVRGGADWPGAWEGVVNKAEEVDND